MWFPNKAEVCSIQFGERLNNNLNLMRRWRGIRGVTGQDRYTTWPRYSCLTFVLSALMMEKREKVSKNTSKHLLMSGRKTANSARISPSQAITSHWWKPTSCMMERSHNAVPWLVQYWACGTHSWLGWKDHTFRQLLVFSHGLSSASCRRLSCEVHTSVCWCQGNNHIRAG